MSEPDEPPRTRPQFPFGHLTADAGASADPVLVEIVQGSLASVEMEVETAIGAHQPQPDDPRRPRLPRRHPRPAAAQAHRPLVLRARAPGRPRLPDRRRCARATCSSTTTSTAPRAASGTCPTCASPCRCSPARGRARVVAFVQAFGHHDDIGGAVPGSMPSARDQRLRGGPDGPADPAVGRRRAQPGGAGDHDPQLPDARVAGRRPRRRVLGLPDGRAPARRAVRPVRRRRPSSPASTRSSTAPPRRTAARSSAKIPVGQWVVGGLRRARRRRRAACCTRSGSR